MTGMAISSQTTKGRRNKSHLDNPRICTSISMRLQIKVLAVHLTKCHKPLSRIDISRSREIVIGASKLDHQVIINKQLDLDKEAWRRRRQGLNQVNQVAVALFTNHSKLSIVPIQSSEMHRAALPTLMLRTSTGLRIDREWELPARAPNKFRTAPTIRTFPQRHALLNRKTWSMLLSREKQTQLTQEIGRLKSRPRTTARQCIHRLANIKTRLTETGRLPWLILTSQTRKAPLSRWEDLRTHKILPNKSMRVSNLIIDKDRATSSHKMREGARAQAMQPKGRLSHHTLNNSVMILINIRSNREEEMRGQTPMLCISHNLRTSMRPKRTPTHVHLTIPDLRLPPSTSSTNMETSRNIQVTTRSRCIRTCQLKKKWIDSSIKKTSMIIRRRLRSRLKETKLILLRKEVGPLVGREEVVIQVIHSSNHNNVIVILKSSNK